MVKLWSLTYGSKWQNKQSRLVSLLRVNQIKTKYNVKQQASRVGLLNGNQSDTHVSI